MSNLTGDHTLAEIVLDKPAAARVLEQLGLDYCRGGAQRLADACAEHDVDPTAVLASLAAIAPGPPEDWATMDPDALVDHIERTHHVYLHAELPRLEALAEKVDGVHGSRHPELAAVLTTFRALRADLEPHLLKEERVLFPMIRDLARATAVPEFHCGTLANPISVMLVEHDRAGALLAELRRLTHGYTVPADGCASYRALYEGLAELEADTHQHVHKESNRLFPMVVELEAKLSTDSHT